MANEKHRMDDGRCGICGGDWSVCGCEGMLRRSASHTGEAEPVAEDAWPKLDKPAMVGGGSFGKGVTTRFVVEAAQRLYEREAETRSKTPEQRIEDERNRRAAWDLFNGSPFAATPAAPGEEDVAKKLWQTIKILGLSNEKLALQAITAALSNPAPVAAPGESHAQLMKFYSVESVDALITAQADHIEKLQARLPRNTAFTVQRVREG